jgi:hypothetical protein
MSIAHDEPLMHHELDDEPPIPASYPRWRRLHIAASAVVALVAIVHAALTFTLPGGWGPTSVWFFGAGLGLLLLATLNLAHIGLGPCRMPTTKLVRMANWAYVAFAIAALVGVPEPQAWLIAAVLTLQAISSRQTLPGPA